MFSIVIWSERHKISNAATESVLLCWAFLWFPLSNSFFPKEYGSYIFSKLLVSVQKENTFFNLVTDLPFLVTKKNTLNHKRRIKKAFSPTISVNDMLNAVKLNCPMNPN